VAFEQDPDCLPTDAGNQLALDRLPGHQAHGPARTAFWWFTANHGDDALLLGIVQDLLGSRPLLLVKGAIQPLAVVPMGDSADGLRGQGERSSDLRCGNAVGQLLQGKGAQDDAHLLNAASQ
jgi:hypothetical protein